jgi:hypothetical protein
MGVTSLAATALQRAILMVENDFEFRVPDSDTILFVSEGTERVVPADQIQKLKTGTERPIDIASYVKTGGTTYTSRAITRDTADSTTQKQTLSWSTAGFHVHTAPIEHDEQIPNAAQDLSNKIKNELITCVQTISSNIETWIEASKTTHFATADEIDGVDVETGQISVNGATFFESLPVFMRKQALVGNFNLLTNVAFMQIMNEYAKYGAGNEKNIEQFMRGINPYYSDTIVPDAGNKIKGYCTPKGSTGLLWWVESDTRRNINKDHVSYYQKTLKFKTLSDKIITIPFGVMEQSGPKDLSSNIPGGQRAYNTDFGFFVDYAKVKLQSSTSGDTPITKIRSSKI